MQVKPRSFTTELGGALALLPYIPRALALTGAASRGWTVAWMALLLLQGLLPAATVYLTRALVNGLVAIVGAGADWNTIRPTLLVAALMAAAVLLAELLRGAGDWIRSAQSDLVSDHIRELIHRKSVAVDLAFYDSQEYYDRLHRAQAQAAHRPVALLESLGSLLQNAITLVAMAGVLIPYGPWLPLALLVSTLPAFYVLLRHRRRRHNWWLDATSEERRSWYYDWLLTSRASAAEMRLFGLGDHFRTAYQALRRHLRGERLRLGRDESLARLAAASAALLVSGAAMAWMVWRALQGMVTLGDLALFYQAFNQGQGLMRSILQNVGEIYGNSLFLADLFEFLALEPQVTELAKPMRLAPQLSTDAAGKGVSIRFRAVTFQYPGSESAVLRDFDLTVAAGEVAAIVGPNGAGKSTLIKLLCRFYDPQAGHIELNGIDLRDLELMDLRHHITVLFQEPVRYNSTVSGNIELGALASQTTAEEIQVAAEAAGADEVIARLPQGYVTQLGTWFEGGTDLSVGEWQRVALARAFLRQAPIIILDEPTSAMDSWAEMDWLTRFRRLASGRTAIIITHRFTTAMHADIIHVMHQGEIVESGSHRELLARGGIYAQSWNAQMRQASQDEQAVAGSSA